MEQNEKIEKSANDSLDEFMGKGTQQNSEETESKNDGSVEVKQPDFKDSEVKSESKDDSDMIDPDEVEIGEAVDGDGTKNKLEDEDAEVIQHGDVKIRVSNKPFVIKEVSRQEDLVPKKIGNKEFTLSRDKTNKWVQTRMEITYEGNDYKTSIPNIKWFPDRYNPKKWTPSFIRIKTDKEYNNSFTNQVSKLYYKFCKSFNKEAGFFGHEEFIKSLVGKKVIVKETEEEFNNKTFRRLDIHKFVE